MKTTVLIVDDDERLLRSYHRLLSQSFEVLVAANASDARAEATRGPPDLVIVDVVLGDESGIDLLRELKADRPELRVAMISASATLDLAVCAVRAGAHAVLAKPVTSAEILRRLLDDDLPPGLDRLKPPTLARVEYEHIARVLADYGGNVKRAARDLGIDRSTLQRKLKESPPK